MRQTKNCGAFRRSDNPFRKGLLLAMLPAGVLAFSNPSRADVIADINASLLTIIADTSTALIDGPPDVAREIAMVNGAVYDAVNAASGGSSQSLYYTGGAVANASPQVAALAAANTMLQNLFGAGSLYATFAGVTGSTYAATYTALQTSNPTLAAQLPSSLATAYAGDAVGPTNAQYAGVVAQLNTIAAQLASVANSADTATPGSGTAATALGAAAANAMIAGRSNDNGVAAMLSTLSYTAPAGAGTVAGVYVPPTSRPALEPGAGAVTPFVTTPDQQSTILSTVPGALDLTSAAYADQVLQTECQGSAGALAANAVAACQAAGLTPQTAAQAQAALYWNDPGGTYQPPGHWLQIADAAASSTGLGLLQHAQEDALVGAAMSDAGAAAWQVKFSGNRWRPVTAIQDCANWNATYSSASSGSSACDPGWTSLIATPPHPDYLAGHPAFSGAAATVLQNFFGSDSISFSVSDQAYCNAGSTQRDSLGNLVSCTLNGTVYAYNPNDLSDCNNAGTGVAAPLNADFSVNTAYNGSPLICPATVTFTGFQDASQGDLGSTFSRVVGGIHTPQAVTDALALGNAIGQAVSQDTGIPEPGTLAVLSISLIGLGMMRRQAVLRTI